MNVAETRKLMDAVASYLNETVMNSISNSEYSELIGLPDNIELNPLKAKIEKYELSEDFTDFKIVNSNLKQYKSNFKYPNQEMKQLTVSYKYKGNVHSDKFEFLSNEKDNVDKSYDDELESYYAVYANSKKELIIAITYYTYIETDKYDNDYSVAFYDFSDAYVTDYSNYGEN